MFSHRQEGKESIEVTEDKLVTIILGQPFLATRWALVDVESGELRFRLNNEEVIFNMGRSMKHPRDRSVISVIDTVDEVVKADVAEQFVVKPLAAMIMNFDRDHRGDFEETMNALMGIGSYTFAPKRPDLDLKNMEFPTANPSMNEPLV